MSPRLPTYICVMFDVVVSVLLWIVLNWSFWDRSSVARLCRASVFLLWFGCDYVFYVDSLRTCVVFEGLCS